MKYTENAINILTVREFPHKGPAWIYKNLRGNEEISTLCRLLNTEKDKFMEVRLSVEKAVMLLEGSIDGVVALGDSDFPSCRGHVKSGDKPFALFYKGDISLLQYENLNVAVIGVLSPDDRVELSEIMVTEEILKHKATIVSGLALGCDSIAHNTALRNNAKTIAILPSVLNDIVPQENAELARKIVEQGGLLVSEYYKKAESRNELISRFVVRDRLQAMFSDAILLVASYAQNDQGNDCGSRHAMGKAMDYEIKRAVIYCEAKHGDNPMYDLNRQILRNDSSVIRIDSTNMTSKVQELLRKKTFF